MPEFKWEFQEYDTKYAHHIAEVFSLPQLIADVLASKGLDSEKKVQDYIFPDLLSLCSPFVFKDMEKVVDRFLKAKKLNQKVLIFGDKDVDGITSTVILYNFLKKLHYNVFFRVPTEKDEYGLCKKSILEAKEQDISLIITVDCGITAIEAVDFANENNIDVIISDHHSIPEITPNAFAIVNPKMEENNSWFEFLSGAGVTFKVIQAISQAIDLKHLYKKELIFFDLETTGLDPNKDEIIEIGAIKVRNNVVIDEFEVLIKPTQTLTAKITEITGIEQSLLDEEGIESEVALTQFLEFIKDDTIIGHNVLGFDLRFLNIILEHLFGKKLTNKVEDTLKLSKSALAGKVKSFKLSNVAKYLGFFSDTEKLHRSVYDSLVTCEVYYRLQYKKCRPYINKLKENISFAAIGTIADMMPIINENRIIVKNGLKSIHFSSLGLIKLLENSAINPETIDTKNISWNIAPPLNSTGRMGLSKLGVFLLACEDHEKVDDLLEKVIQTDNQRKDIVQEVYQTIQKEFLNRFNEIEEEKLFFYASPTIKKGITGLVATKFCYQYQVPTIIIATNLESNISSGSIRSTGDFNVVEALKYLSSHLTQFGGHQAAGGFSILNEQIPIFKEEFIKYMQSYNKQFLLKKINICKSLTHLDSITIANVKLLKYILQPIGYHNEAPNFLIEDVKITSSTIIGKDKSHVLFIFEKDKHSFSTIAWSFAKKWDDKYKNTAMFDIVITPDINNFQNKEEVRMILVDLKKVTNK